MTAILTRSPGMIARPDLLDAKSPRGIEVFQLTSEAAPSSHIYMEAQIFTLDSRYFLLHRSAHPHGSDQNDPEHKYLLCEVATGKLTPVTDETGATAPSVAPDGKSFYYFVNQTRPGGGTGSKLVLKRRNLDGSNPETIVALDGPLPGTRFWPSKIYPLSTISSDGQRLALSCFLGDGKTAGGGAPWGMMVFDVPSASVNLIVHGPSWCNMHPQYSRSLDPVRKHDILIQDNHANACDASGKVVKLVGGLGADIHVVRDDGQSFRDLPWGRDGNEQCQGHQCWRGRSDWAITSTVTADVGGRPEAQLIESLPVPHVDHDGLRSPGGVRNHLSREFPRPDFYHFATDIEGRWFITDCGPADQRGSIWFAGLGEPGKAALQRMTYLLTPRSSWHKGAHMHPFLSPDGRTGFFNSDESGVLQTYMVRGLPG